MRIIKDFIATGFYTGCTPIAPAFSASWSAAMAYTILSSVFFPTQSMVLAIVGATLLLILGLFSIPNDEINIIAKNIVIDKWAGQFICFTLIELNTLYLFLSVIMFLIFDKIEIWSSNESLSEKPKYYSMVHSVTAGCFTALLLWGVQTLFN